MAINFENCFTYQAYETLDQYQIGAELHEKITAYT